MLSCDEVVSHILRGVDGDDRSASDLEAHLASCAGCRKAFDEQRVVARILRERPVDAVSPAFAARLNNRLDETIGWLGIADWRAWTIRLSPAVAALGLAAFLTSDAATAAPTLADWTTSGPAEMSEAALLWEPEVTPESVVESMLGGSVAASTGAGDNGR